MMTRQDNISTESKVTRVAFDYYKNCPSPLEIDSSQSGTALCSAVLAQSGADAMVPAVPWPVPGHHRLDARQSPLGASQRAKKTFLLDRRNEDREVAGLRQLHGRENVAREQGAPDVMLLLLLPGAGDDRIRNERSGAFELRQAYAPDLPLTNGEAPTRLQRKHVADFGATFVSQTYHRSIGRRSYLSPTAFWFLRSSLRAHITWR